MLDVDTVSTFMISVVTTYFSTCGDSLETVLEGKPNSVLKHSPKKGSPNSYRHQFDSAVAYSVDGTNSICHSMNLVENDGEPFEIQRMNGTDMIFFPQPSSEMPFSIRKKQPTPIPIVPPVQRIHSNDKLKQDGVETPSFIVQNLGRISTKSVISPPSEVTPEWIPMGMMKENIQCTIPLRQQQQKNTNTTSKNNNHYKNNPYPFDEMRYENSKRPPLAIRAHSRHQKITATISSARSDSESRENSQVPVQAMSNNIFNGIEFLQVRTRPSSAATTNNYGNDDALYDREGFVVRKFEAPQKHRRQRIQTKKMPSHWKSAEDPRTGQTYYFHEITRETQWRKPLELASDAEKSAMQEKEQKEKDFFAAMEANILSSLSRGVIPGTPAQERPAKEDLEAPEDERRLEKQKSLRRLRSRGGRPEFVRTISTMDESALTDVIRRQPSFRSVHTAMSNEGFSEYSESVDEYDSSCSSSVASHGSHLETLEEDVGEFNNSIEIESDRDVRPPRNKSRPLERSMSTRNDLNDEETQALNKLYNLTKEMMDADKDEVPRLTRTGGATPGPAIGALRRATDGDIGRALPRELEFGDSDGKKAKDKPTPTPTPKAVPRRERAARMLANSGNTAKDLLRSSAVQRRNTCGTMYIRTTMSAPDKDATIRCVCGVYRSHIISSSYTHLSGDESESLSVFNDYPDDTNELQNRNPTLDEITTFYRDIFYKAQMEADCIIMSLIYVERLIKKTIGLLRPKASNWRSLLFSCMILSSKVWDDLSMWNADFSQSCPPGGVNFSLQRINQLELAILNTLKFNVKVPASEYAKYYFLLRSMLIKSGLGGEDLGSLDPLDVDGARRLAQVSSQFESMSLDSATSDAFQRSKSLVVGTSKSLRQSKTKLGLEQVVKM